VQLVPQNRQFDPNGQFFGWCEMVLGQLYKAKHKRELVGPTFDRGRGDHVAIRAVADAGENRVSIGGVSGSICSAVIFASRTGFRWLRMDQLPNNDPTRSRSPMTTSGRVRRSRAPIGTAGTQHHARCPLHLDPSCPFRAQIAVVRGDMARRIGQIDLSGRDRQLSRLIIVGAGLQFAPRSEIRSFQSEIVVHTNVMLGAGSA
jgi:hypothetical protein